MSRDNRATVAERFQVHEMVREPCRSVLQGAGDEREDDRANGWQEDTYIQHQGTVNNTRSKSHPLRAPHKTIAFI